MKKFLSVFLLWVLCAACACAARADGVVFDWDFIDEYYKVDGETRAYMRALFPYLEGMEDQQAMEGVNAAIRNFILTEGGYGQVCAYAQEAYEEDPAAFVFDYQYSLWASGMWALRTEELLAVRYDFEADTNGPHPWQTIAAQHYDLRTGKPVALESLVRDPAALRALVAEETTQWIASSDYEAFEDADASSWTPEQGLLTRDGLLVFFNEGEMGPVAAGALVFTIPYERLGDAFTVDTRPASEGNTMQELLEQAAWMYEGGEFWLGDRLTDWVLAEEPKNLEALLTRAEGYCDVDVGDTELVFELLAQIEPLAAGTPRYDRLLAEALYCRAMDKLYVAPEYAGAEPGDEAYHVYSEIFQDLERAIQLDPTDVNYYNAVNSIAYDMGLFGDENVHEVSDNIQEILGYYGDLRGYPDLYAQLNNAGKLDEAAEVLAAWKADESPGTETASDDYCIRADDAYEAGKYEEAIALYREALETGWEAQAQWTPDVPDIVPQRLWYRLADAYMRLDRFEEAAGILGEMEEWYDSYFEAGAIFYNQCAEALLALGRTGEAREVLLESLEIWDNEAGEVLLEKIAAMLPAAAAGVFAGEEWAGYVPVTTGHFYMYYEWGIWEDWEEVSGPLVTVMQKDGHNVLCVLRESGSEGYRLVLANDRAVRQGTNSRESISTTRGDPYISNT